MLEILSPALQKQAVLENVVDLQEELRLEGVWQMTFSLPEKDDKNLFCRPFHYVRLENRLYRLLPSGADFSETGMRRYQCEHVLATLLDTCMFGFVQLGGTEMGTRQVLESILSRQTHWRLGDCAFDFPFEYGFSQENLLSAVMAVPRCFNTAYRWDYDTSAYPWTLHLRALDVNSPPTICLDSRRSLLSAASEQDLTRLCTRLYPLGYGEGVNQLTIAKVNGGVPYLQSPPEIVAKYGIIQRIWVDRQYEDAQSLKAAAETMLEQLQTPYIAYEASLAELNGETISLGDRVQLRLGDETVRSYITAIKRDYDNLTRSTVTLANRPADIAKTVERLADRARVESSYAQGATNLYAQSLQANADSIEGAAIHFYLPAEMRQVNRVLCKVKLERFRAYSKLTSSGGSTAATSRASGAFSITSSGGGSGSVSSTSEGSVNTSTGSGGGLNTSLSGGSATTTSGAGGGWTGSTGTPARYQGGYADYEVHTHAVQVNAHSHSVSLPAHSHSVNISNHTHSVNIGRHSHSVSLPSHSHSVSGGSHTHTVDIPSHTHTVNPGIHRFGTPTGFDIYVNGVFRQTVTDTTGEFDVTQWMGTLQDGRIGRDRWHKVEIVPNDLAYVVLDLFVQGFVQSRGDFTL